MENKPNHANWVSKTFLIFAGGFTLVAIVLFPGTLFL